MFILEQDTRRVMFISPQKKILKLDTAMTSFKKTKISFFEALVIRGNVTCIILLMSPNYKVPPLKKSFGLFL